MKVYEHLTKSLCRTFIYVARGLMNEELGIVRRAWRLIRREGLRSFIRKAVMLINEKTGVVSFLLAPYIAYKARRLDLDRLLNELFSDKSILSMLYRPMQIRWEIEKLAKMLRELNPRYILEIGTARGGTLFIWTRVAGEDALIISIDLPGGAFGGGYPLLKGYTYKLFARGRQRIILLRGDSHNLETFLRVEKILKGAKLDFLFIDGDHSYEGVRKDYIMYSKLVRKEGIIAFHDIVPGPEKNVGGVPHFWTELKNELKKERVAETLEIIENREQGGYGIGLLFWKPHYRA